MTQILESLDKIKALALQDEYHKVTDMSSPVIKPVRQLPD